jgi:hypothetical protein
MVAEVLDDPVVQVTGDPPALGLGRVRGGHQQSLPITAGPLEAPGERPEHRRGHRDQDEKPAETDRLELVVDLLALPGDVFGGVVGLEEQRLSVGRDDPRVHLQQSLLAGLEPVLGLTQVGDLGVAGALLLQHLQLVVPQGETIADQPSLVAVDDAPVGGPDLDALDVPDQHAVGDDAVEPVGGSDVTLHQPSGDRRLGHRQRQQLGGLPRVQDRLLVGGTTAELYRDGDDGHEHDEPGGQELDHRVLDVPHAGPPLRRRAVHSMTVESLRSRRFRDTPRPSVGWWPGRRWCRCPLG